MRTTLLGGPNSGEEINIPDHLDTYLTPLQHRLDDTIFEVTDLDTVINSLRPRAAIYRRQFTLCGIRYFYTGDW